MTVAISHLLLVAFFATMKQLQGHPPSSSPAANRTTKTYAQNQAIVFPDSQDINHRSIPALHGKPPCAQDSTFCEDVDGYPYNEVQNLLKRNRSLDVLFGVDEAPNEFANRMGYDEHRFLCDSEERLIFPKVGKTKKNTWQYIINQENTPGGYVQGVRIELCRNAERPCDLFESLPHGYITSCKQKYIYRRLLSLTDQGVTTHELFELPSSCCCSYTHDTNSILRELISIFED